MCIYPLCSFFYICQELSCINGWIKLKLIYVTWIWLDKVKVKLRNVDPRIDTGKLLTSINGGAEWIDENTNRLPVRYSW